jgi:hypothetical protein
MRLGYQVKLRFMIDQKDSLETMLIIKDQLNLFLTFRKLPKDINTEIKSKIANNFTDMHRIESNSFIKVPLIIDYLTQFKLKSKKKESFNK